MSYIVRIRRSAERDIEIAQSWYEDQRTGLGEEFHAEIDRVLEILAQFPLIYQVAHGEARKVELKRFPYLVWYRVRGTTVQVLAVTDGRREPEKSYSRLA